MFYERRRERLSSLYLSLSSVSGTSIVAKYTPVWYSSNDKSPVVVFIVITKLSSCLGGLTVHLALGGVTDMPHFSANETATPMQSATLSDLQLFKVVLVALIHEAAAA